MSGWVFVVLGIVLGAVASFLIYYGQNLLRQAGVTPAASPTAARELPLLDAQQERLLRLVHKYQVEFGARKLVIGRGGDLYFDEPPRVRRGVNLVQELYGTPKGDASRANEFQALMEGMPPEYLRSFPETRLDSPFVVSVTEAGIGYLRGRH